MPSGNVALRLIVSVVVVILSTGTSRAGHPVHAAQYPATPVQSQSPATRAQMGHRYLPAPVGQPAAYYGVNTSISEMAAEIAELKAWKAEVLADDAASKKKPASDRNWKIGGRIYFDTAMFSQNDQSLAQGITARNGTEIRRAWLSISGEASQMLDYCLQLEFAGSKTISGTRFQSTCFKDAYLGFRDLPYVGNLRIGHIREPLSLEQMTSNRYITFMERSMNDYGTFVPSRNLGVKAFHHTKNERSTWAIGAFVAEQTPEPLFHQVNHSGAAVTGRWSYLPWFDEAAEGRRLIHVGLGGSYRSIGDQTVRFRARPEAHLGPYVVDTGVLHVPDYQLLNTELAFVYGPFSLQSEYFHAVMNESTGNNLDFNGCYFMASYFLTGEHRPYSRKTGGFARVKPRENFFRVRDSTDCIRMGKGAWQLAYRYSYIDLDDGTIAGGRAGNHTFGVNWYLSPHARLMVNCLHCTTERAGIDSGVLSAFQMRAHVDF